MDELNFKDFDLKTHFIDYWDKVVRQWLDWDDKTADGTDEAKAAAEQRQIIEAINKTYEKAPQYQINTIHMPEPYWGNPEKCSIVLLNYNPAGGPRVNRHTTISCKDCKGCKSPSSEDKEIIPSMTFIKYVQKKGYSHFAADESPVFKTKEELGTDMKWFWDEGKTETVYQLARQTGRSIMVVDVPRIKSKWVGESEKNIKALFDRYREQVKRAPLTPILLFNEADAIIGIRKNGAQSAVDKMENSIQNIILQEMETLDGIMIATTNLQQNMDKAFERRFLYKIKFDKPTEEARTCIWRSMIPDLSELDVHTLASKYDFSGGQIENIARHYAIDNILHGQSEDVLSMLIRHCDNERLDDKEQKKIGF